MHLSDMFGHLSSTVEHVSSIDRAFLCIYVHFGAMSRKALTGLMQIWCKQQTIVCAMSLDLEFILIAIVKHMSAVSREIVQFLGVSCSCISSI